MTNSQICRDMDIPMTQEFVSVMDDGEGKLNQEIDDLLEGIDFQKSLSQENSQTCIPSTYPEENGKNTIKQSKDSRDEENVLTSSSFYTRS